MPRMNREKALKAELAKRGFESISVKRELPGGRVEVEANKLHPVHVEGGRDDLRARPRLCYRLRLTRAAASRSSRR